MNIDGQHAQYFLADAIKFIENHKEIDANELQAELYAKHRSRYVSEGAI